MYSLCDILTEGVITMSNESVARDAHLKAELTAEILALEENYTIIRKVPFRNGIRFPGNHRDIANVQNRLG